MAVDRKLLQQALLNAQGISKRAEAGTGFDPRGGAGVAALQIATAGIGAFAQNRAKKALEEDRINKTAAFEAARPQYKGLNLSIETQDAIGLAEATARIKQQFAIPKEPKFEIKEGEGGFFRVNPQTGETFPISGQAGSQLKSKPPKPLVEVKTGGVETEFEKSRGKGKATKLQSILDAGDTATAFDLNLDQIEQALDEGAFVGAGATQIATINEVAAAFGLPVDLDKSANTRKIQQRVGELTLQATGKLKGAISEKELKLAERTVFDIGTSEAATRKGIQTLRTLSSYDQRLADMASNLESEGKFTTNFRKEKKAFDREFRKELRKGLKSTNDQLSQEDPQQGSTTGFKILSIE
jgi:hypothetical protein